MADRYDDAERARRLAERAGHDSVTEAVLLGTGRFSNEFYLYGKPAVAHLDDGELPQFAFFNQMKGVGVGGKRETRTPDEGGVTVMLLTDRRVLALLGRRDGDERLTVPYDVVTGADYSTGLMKHRIAVDTVDTTYHLWVDSGYEESALRAAAEFLRDRADGGRATDLGTDPAAVSGDGGDDPAAGSDPARGTGPGPDRTPGADRPRSGSDPTRPRTGSDPGTSRGGSDPTPSRGDGDQPSSGGGGEPARTGGGTDGGDDPLEKLERLEELKQKGVVTEEEFEEKKAELLDQI